MPIREKILAAFGETAKRAANPENRISAKYKIARVLKMKDLVVKVGGKPRWNEKYKVESFPGKSASRDIIIYVIKTKDGKFIAQVAYDRRDGHVSKRVRKATAMATYKKPIRAKRKTRKAANRKHPSGFGDNDVNFQVLKWDIGVQRSKVVNWKVAVSIFKEWVTVMGGVKYKPPSKLQPTSWVIERPRDGNAVEIVRVKKATAMTIREKNSRSFR